MCYWICFYYECSYTFLCFFFFYFFCLSYCEKASYIARLVFSTSLTRSWPRTPRRSAVIKKSRVDRATIFYVHCTTFSNISLFQLMNHHQSVFTDGMSFSANSGTKAAVLPKSRSFTANSGTRVAVFQGMNRCDNFPLLCAPHSLFSI